MNLWRIKLKLKLLVNHFSLKKIGFFLFCPHIKVTSALFKVMNGFYQDDCVKTNCI